MRNYYFEDLVGINTKENIAKESRPVLALLSRLPPGLFTRNRLVLPVARCEGLSLGAMEAYTTVAALRDAFLRQPLEKKANRAEEKEGNWSENEDHERNTLGSIALNDTAEVRLGLDLRVESRNSTFFGVRLVGELFEAQIQFAEAFHQDFVVGLVMEGRLGLGFRVGGIDDTTRVAMRLVGQLLVALVEFAEACHEGLVVGVIMGGFGSIRGLWWNRLRVRRVLGEKCRGPSAQTGDVVIDGCAQGRG